MIKKVKIFALVIIFFVIGSSTNAQSTAELNYGTQVSVLIDTEVSSENTSTVTGHIFSDVKDRNRNIIIKEGTPVDLEIIRNKRKGVGKPGKLEIKFLSTKAIDGQTIILNGSKFVEGENKKGKALGIGIGIGVGLLFLPMLAYIAKKGGPAELPANTVIHNVTLAKDYEVSLNPNNNQYSSLE
jgi:hypothetical protein